MTDLTKRNNLAGDGTGDVGAKRPTGNGLRPCHRISAHDPQFDNAMQVQVTVPRAIFEQQGIEMTEGEVMQLVDKVLLKMPRFAQFKLGAGIDMSDTGARIILENKDIFSLGRDCSVISLTLPDDFVLPSPLLNKLGESL